MRVLLLRSDVPGDAPPDELDTLATVEAVAAALSTRGHDVTEEIFVPDAARLDRALSNAAADVVFNLVESVFGQGNLAGVAPAMLEKRGVSFTGASAAAISCYADKPLTKRFLRAAELPTPDWAESPFEDGLEEGQLYVVKSANEDCSVGLDDASVVRGKDAVRARAASAAAHHGGTWFAEAYCPGREFNVSLLGTDDGPRVLPIAEIVFANWQPDRPRIVGYAAKWDVYSVDSKATPRRFGIEEEAPQLARRLAELSCSAWHLLGLRGYARVDFRLDAAGAPTILEVNPNPCLEPEAGFAAAALQDGISYTELVSRILEAALRE
jgi:D-alanine-D-alanine ligase